MATTERKRVRARTATDSAKKRTRISWDKLNPRIRIGEAQFERWIQIKQQFGMETHDKVASLLLDTWLNYTGKADDSETPKGPLTPGKPSKMHEDVPCQSTPAATGKNLPPIESDNGVSEISRDESETPSLSGIESPSLSGIEEHKTSLLEEYEKKAAETDASFIEISIDYGSDGEEDVTYIPSESEEDSFDYEEDMTFDISLCTQSVSKVDSLPLAARNDVMLDISVDDGFEEENMEIEVEDPPQTERQLVSEKKSLCYESALLDLAMLKIPSKCQRKGCNGEITVNCRYVGSAAKLIWVCSKGHTVYTWNSQPHIKRMFAGNFLLSSTILTSGNNYKKIALLFKFLNLGITNASSHYKIQRHFAAPVIDEYFQEMIDRTCAKYEGKEIILAGDGRNDSPGHSAMYCTYTFMEYESKDIVACRVIDKRMTDLKSANMEKAGLIRALRSVHQKNIAIKEICTDAHTQISHFLSQNHPDIKHSYDTWHGAKNFGKKLTSVACEKDNHQLQPWVKDIINHFWYCSRKAEGEEGKFVSTWRGILHHVVNVHRWVLGDSSGPAKCEHEPILDVGNADKWIDPGSSPHKALAKLVLNIRFLHTLKYFVNFRHTGELENFHEHILMYAAKRFSYSYPMYKARNQLACIDYQKHKDRPDAVDKHGIPEYQRLYSKRNNTWSAVAVKEAKKYSYMQDLLTRMIQKCKTQRGRLSDPVPLEAEHPKLIQSTIAAVSPLPTRELVASKKSRFKDN